MKALSIQEPWLTLIMRREKTIETRTWKTAHRGDLLLVGSKQPKGIYAGKAACIVNLVDCRPMVKADEKDARCRVYPGAYSWVFSNIRSVVPFPVRGQLRLYDVWNERVTEIAQKGVSK